MPNRKTHERISTKFLGKPYTEVHKAIDRPHKRFWKKGRRGFKLLSHHPFIAAVIASIVVRDKLAWTAGLLHAMTDHVHKMNKLKKRVYFRLHRT